MSTHYDSIVEAAEKLVATANEAADPIVVAHVLAELRDAKQDLARCYDDAERAMLAVAGEKSYEIPGLGVVEIKKATKRTQWRHDELVPAIVARALDERVFDPDTGEASEREADTVARVLRECVSFGAGKVTGLRARGIQPDEYCLEEEGKFGVKLPSRVEA